MPRMARVGFLNYWCQVVQRGHNPSAVLLDLIDYRCYLDTLAEWRQQFGGRV